MIRESCSTGAPRRARGSRIRRHAVDRVTRIARRPPLKEEIQRVVPGPSTPRGTEVKVGASRRGSPRPSTHRARKAEGTSVCPSRRWPSGAAGDCPRRRLVRRPGLGAAPRRRHGVTGSAPTAGAADPRCGADVPRPVLRTQGAIATRTTNVPVPRVVKTSPALSGRSGPAARVGTDFLDEEKYRRTWRRCRDHRAAPSAGRCAVIRHRRRCRRTSAPAATARACTTSSRPRGGSRGRGRGTRRPAA